MAAASPLPEYTVDEVRKHETESDCWVIWHGNVYRLPEDFIVSHPGGPILMESAGRDGTIMFEDNGHPDSARDLMKEFKIGTLKK
jgi:cytochrome b involved in lipid metabolism